MAAALLWQSWDGLAIVRPNFCKASKIDQFGVNFKVRVVVDNCVVPPYRKITGKIVVETSFPIRHEGILIQFEALCTLRYATKYEDITVMHEGRQSILENTKPEVNGYQESPLRHVVLTGNLYDWVNHSLNTGTITYPPFIIEIPENLQLPAPFKNSFGSLTYRLAVYMKPMDGMYVEVGEKCLTQTFNGHHNLRYNTAALKPISVESFYKKSGFFTSRTLVEVLFSAPKSGYLPGERIPFVMHVKNPQCIGLHSKVELIKQTKYEANKRRSSSKVNKQAILGVMENNEENPSAEFSWSETLTIPEKQEPSFTGQSIYNVIYYIQFTVKLVNHGVVKGKAPVFIGTTRDSAPRLSDPNLSHIPFQALRRLGLTSSRQSYPSSTKSSPGLPPPTYSQLSSRISSTETLPPTYDEAERLDKKPNVQKVSSPVGGQDNVIIEEEAEAQMNAA